MKDYEGTMLKAGTRLFLAIGGGVLFAAGFAACGSSDSDGVTDQPDAAEASTPDTGAPDTGRDTSVPDTGPPDTGPIYDAGPTTILDGGDLYEGGVPCVVGGILEMEPNDDPDAATLFDPTVCGVIFKNVDAGDAGFATEDDYVKFLLDAGTTNFHVQYGGNVKLDITVADAGPFTVGPGSTPNLPLVRGQPYIVRVYSANGQRQAWRVTLFQR